MWLMRGESLASLVWVFGLARRSLIAALVARPAARTCSASRSLGGSPSPSSRRLQLLVALWLEHSYDPTILRAFLVAALYPVAYWVIPAPPAIRSQIVALVRGPRGQRVVWDIPRERIGAG